ncbi:MAG: CoA pyrophosphatase [Marmoricola sp.]|nr:CoA pyrophosphatase [Marmoricola sp.]
MTPDDLAAVLLDPAEASAIKTGGSVEAAVLVPLFWDERGPVAIFTERSADLRRHAGQISFPGGRRDPGETLLETALRESEEEIGLPRDQVRILGALPPLGTVLSDYRVYPFVGVIPAGLTWTPAPSEVARVFEFPIADLVAGHRHTRLLSKGIPFRTSTYTVEGQLVWGATARFVRELLDRLPTT